MGPEIFGTSRTGGNMGQGFLQARFGGETPPPPPPRKISYSPPPQIFTDFIFIHPEPPTPRLLPPKSFNSLPPKGEILQETLMGPEIFGTGRTGGNMGPEIFGTGSERVNYRYFKKKKEKQNMLRIKRGLSERNLPGVPLRCVSHKFNITICPKFLSKRNWRSYSLICREVHRVPLCHWTPS